MKASVELENFTVSEVDALDTRLQVFLQALRYIVGEPIYITSGLRVESTTAHGDGTAVDISDNQGGAPLKSQWRHKVLKALYGMGFERIGTYDLHIHLDVNLTFPQSVTWWGRSR